MCVEHNTVKLRKIDIRIRSHGLMVLYFVLIFLFVKNCMHARANGLTRVR